VGGGTVCLRLGRRRALWPGLFVAPGVLGLFLGKQLGGSELFAFQPWLFTVLLVAAALPGLLLQAPHRSPMAEISRFRGFGLTVAVLLFTVAVRSLAGFSLVLPWATGWQAAGMLALAAFGGKALGGLLGDKFGWKTVTTIGLLLAAALITFGSSQPVMALMGVLCLNLTMAITLASLAYLLPGFEGLAFGLTATAIVVGLTPTIFGPFRPFLNHPAVIAGFILVSAVLLWPVLGQIERRMGHNHR
jgi:hypothetical protein